MNILIYFGNQLNPKNGGTERAACLIGDYLSRQGHNIFFLACHPANNEGSLSSSFLPDEREWPTTANINFVKALLAEKNIDIIINEGAYGDSVFLFSHEHIPSNVKIISHIHFDPISSDRHFYKTLNLPIAGIGPKEACLNILKWMKAPYNRQLSISNKKKRFSYLLDRSDKVVLLTETHVRDFKELLLHGDFSKLEALDNPITFDKTSTSYEKKLNDILFVGRLDYSSKRVDRILHVWALLQHRYPDWTLTIVGDGDDRSRLERLSRKLKLERIVFTGRTDSAPYYARAKLLLMTSNYEGCPMVIPEAMAYGTVPVVMNNFSGARHMISDGINGCLTKPFNIYNMVETISCLIENPLKIRELGYNAVSTINAIDNESLLSEWDKVIS